MSAKNDDFETLFLSIQSYTFQNGTFYNGTQDPLSLYSELDIKQIRNSAPSGCFIVLVGGKFTKRMNDIVRKVDYITSQMAIKLVTYFAEKTEVMPEIDIDNSPAIVRD